MKVNYQLQKHIQLFLPILDALRQLGGSATPEELKDKLVENLDISDAELEEKYKSNISKIDNQISWSTIYLVRAGLLDRSDPKIWSLTEDGLKKNLTEEDVRDIFKQIHTEFASRKTKVPKKEQQRMENNEVERIDGSTHQSELLEILKKLPPDGFERICQRLLRSLGFKKVVVKGRSGDGGIDGEGILEVNPLVSLKVIFQSKRYRDAVSSSEIRDFRGAMQGRAEKALFITTGRFTRDAKIEAFRDGVPPIELVDGEKLVKLFEEKRLGLRAKTIFEIDQDFFEEYTTKID